MWSPLCPQKGGEFAKADVRSPLSKKKKKSSKAVSREPEAGSSSFMVWASEGVLSPWDGLDMAGHSHATSYRTVCSISHRVEQAGSCSQWW